MGTALNNLFGKGKSTLAGDVEFWHGAERTGWLMKQGEPRILVCLETCSILKHLAGVGGPPFRLPTPQSNT